MKINRSAKCSLKFVNSNKIRKLEEILAEYGRVVNLFIDQFWPEPPPTAALLKPTIDSVDTWFSYRLRHEAAREAVGMVKSAKKKGIKPIHHGKRMCLTSDIVELQEAKAATEFDCWLHLNSIGNKMILNLPVKLHKHFHKWDEKGQRRNAYIITKDYVQFSFQVETGPKKEPDRCVGIDTGIKALATLSTGKQLGIDIEANIERIKRCKHGSKGQQRATRALKHKMDMVAREVTQEVSLVVVEKLTGITKNTKRCLVRSMRRSIGRWNVHYWLNRLQMTCEETNVSFRQVSAYQTSQICNHCGHIDRRNRSGEKFLCLSCGHADNADINAAKNILDRFLSGPSGAGCKPLTLANSNVC